MTTVELIYFNAGGGHHASMKALETTLGAQRPGWAVRSTNLFEILDPADRFRRTFHMAPEDLYNKQLELGWTAGMAFQNRVLHATVRVGRSLLVRRLRDYWVRTQPDLVVSLIPHINLAIEHSLRATLPDVPFATVLTDMADYPPHFWIEPGTSQHVICGTARAYQQALGMGVPRDHVHQTSGMIVRPDFYDAHEDDPTITHAALGLDPSQPTGVVMFGGHGSTAMLGIASRLSDVQLILMTGRNPGLARRLSRRTSAAPHAVIEYTAQVRSYMRLGDFFIGKPGPGALSEAVQQGLPVITMRNAWTMPQERYNTDWLAEHRLGIVVNSTRRIRPAVESLLDEREVFRSRVALVANRAVFEVPDILAGILDRRAVTPIAAETAEAYERSVG